jgi:hypothetical protein
MRFIDARRADLAIEPLQLRAQLGQYPGHDRIDPAQKMTLRNASFEVEETEQLALIDRLPTHHHPASVPDPSNAAACAGASAYQDLRQALLFCGVFRRLSHFSALVLAALSGNQYTTRRVQCLIGNEPSMMTSAR